MIGFSEEPEFCPAHGYAYMRKRDYRDRTAYCAACDTEEGHMNKEREPDESAAELKQAHDDLDTLEVPRVDRGLALSVPGRILLMARQHRLRFSRLIDEASYADLQASGGLPEAQIPSGFCAPGGKESCLHLGQRERCNDCPVYGDDVTMKPEIQPTEHVPATPAAENQIARLCQKLKEILDITQDMTPGIECWEKIQNIEATAASALAIPNGERGTAT